jgi:hypothetical protein
LGRAPQPGDVVEVDRTVDRFGTVSLGQRPVVAADILSGRRVGIRIGTTTLAFFDSQTRQLASPETYLAAALPHRLRARRPMQALAPSEADRTRPAAHAGALIQEEVSSATPRPSSCAICTSAPPRFATNAPQLGGEQRVLIGVFYALGDGLQP